MWGLSECKHDLDTRGFHYSNLEFGPPAGSRTEGEADLKLGVLVNKLITCPEASACASKAFIKFTCADRFFVLLPWAEPRETTLNVLLRHPPGSLSPPRARWPRSGCIWCPSWTFRWLPRSSWARSLQHLPLRSDGRLLGSFTLPCRSTRLIQPLTSLLTLDCAG